MQTTKRHFASVLVGSVLVLLAAGELKAAQPFADGGDRISGLGTPVAENSFGPTTTPNTALEQPNTSMAQEQPSASADQGDRENDHWFRWRYYWSYRYYRPVHYCYYYYYRPRVIWYPSVVIFDGAKGQANDSAEGTSDKLVPDGQ